MGGNEEKAHPLSVEGTGHMVQDAGCRAHPLSVEPPCAMKPGMTRCMRAPAYLRASKREYERRRQRESEIERARAQSERERDRESAERERERERERESERERERERPSFIQRARIRHPKVRHQKYKGWSSKVQEPQPGVSCLMPTCVRGWHPGRAAQSSRPSSERPFRRVRSGLT